MSRDALLRATGLLLLAVMLLGPAARPVAAQEENAGTIEGRVVNATSGGASVAGSTVVLNILGEDDQIERRQAVVGEDGSYRFEGLSTRPGLKYLPLIEFQGASYFPRPLTLDQQPRQEANITVYDGTDSDRWVAYERANLMIQGLSPNRLDLMEMGAVANVGDRTYLGAQPDEGVQRVTLRFSLPAGAAGVTPMAGFAPNDFHPDPNGFSIASPVVPGRHQLAFAYSLPYRGQALSFSRRLDYPAMVFNLYVPDAGLQVESSVLQPQGEADLGGQRYLLYSAQNLPRGTEIPIRLVGLPVATPSTGETLLWPVAAVGGLALMAGILVAYRRRQLKVAPPLVTAASREQAELERVRLLLTLARLDDSFAQGALSQEQYEHERERNKRALVGLGSAQRVSRSE